MASLVDCLEASTARFPERPAVVDRDSAVWTYRELNQHSARLASFLQSRGIGTGDRVGLLLPNSRINTSPTEYRVVTYMQLQRFNGASWDDVR